MSVKCSLISCNFLLFTRNLLNFIIEEHLEVVKHRSLIVSLVYVYVVCPVFPAAAVCLSSVLPTCGTLHYVGDKQTLGDCCGTAEYILSKFLERNYKIK